MHKARYQSQRNTIIYNPANPISPLQYYIELHKHNTELCYLGQKKNKAQEAQFAGRWIRSKNKIINIIATKKVGNTNGKIKCSTMFIM